jgi:hypothetical protein
MAFTAGQKVRASQLNALSNGEITSALITTSSASGITTTETVLDYLTGTLAAGRTYECGWQGDLVHSTASSTYALRVRYLAAAALVVAGSTKVRGKFVQTVATLGNHDPNFVTARFVAPTTAQYAVGVCIVRLTGTGSVQAIAGADNERFIWLNDVTKP